MKNLFRSFGLFAALVGVLCIMPDTVSPIHLVFAADQASTGSLLPCVTLDFKQCVFGGSESSGFFDILKDIALAIPNLLVFAISSIGYFLFFCLYAICTLALIIGVYFIDLLAFVPDFFNDPSFFGIFNTTLNAVGWISIAFIFILWLVQLIGALTGFVDRDMKDIMLFGAAKMLVSIGLIFGIPSVIYGVSKVTNEVGMSTINTISGRTKETGVSYKNRNVFLTTTLAVLNKEVAVETDPSNPQASKTVFRDMYGTADSGKKLKDILQNRKIDTSGIGKIINGFEIVRLIFTDMWVQDFDNPKAVFRGTVMSVIMLYSFFYLAKALIGYTGSFMLALIMIPMFPVAFFSEAGKRFTSGFKGIILEFFIHRAILFMGIGVILSLIMNSTPEALSSLTGMLILGLFVFMLGKIGDLVAALGFGGMESTKSAVNSMKEILPVMSDERKNNEIKDVAKRVEESSRKKDMGLSANEFEKDNKSGLSKRFDLGSIIGGAVQKYSDRNVFDKYGADTQNLKLKEKRGEILSSDEDKKSGNPEKFVFDDLQKNFDTTEEEKKLLDISKDLVSFKNSSDKHTAIQKLTNKIKSKKDMAKGAIKSLLKHNDPRVRSQAIRFAIWNEKDFNIDNHEFNELSPDEKSAFIKAQMIGGDISKNQEIFAHEFQRNPTLLKEVLSEELSGNKLNSENEKNLFRLLKSEYTALQNKVGLLKHINKEHPNIHDLSILDDKSMDVTKERLDSYFNGQIEKIQVSEMPEEDKKAEILKWNKVKEDSFSSIAGLKDKVAYINSLGNISDKNESDLIKIDSSKLDNKHKEELIAKKRSVYQGFIKNATLKDPNEKITSLSRARKLFERPASKEELSIRDAVTSEIYNKVDNASFGKLTDENKVKYIEAVGAKFGAAAPSQLNQVLTDRNYLEQAISIYRTLNKRPETDAIPSVDDQGKSTNTDEQIIHQDVPQSISGQKEVVLEKSSVSQKMETPIVAEEVRIPKQPQASVVSQKARVTSNPAAVTASPGYEQVISRAVEPHKVVIRQEVPKINSDSSKQVADFDFGNILDKLRSTVSKKVNADESQESLPHKEKEPPFTSAENISSDNMDIDKSANTVSPQNIFKI